MYISSSLLGVIYLLIAVLPGFLIFLYRKKYQVESFGGVLSTMCVLVTAWMLCNAIMQFCRTDSAIIFWHEAKLAVRAFVPPLILLFAMEQTSLKLPLLSKTPKFIFILPVMTVLMTLTNPIHHFLRTSLSVSIDHIVIVHTVNAWWYNLHMLYSYTLLVLSILLFLIDYFRQPRVYRRRPLLILLGVTVPSVANCFFDSGLIHPQMPLETAPLAIILGALFIYYALYIYRPVKIIPIARDLIVENMENLVCLIDNNNTVLDINLAAARLLQSPRSQLIGKSINNLINSYDFLSRLKASLTDGEVLTIQKDEKETYYKLNIVILKDNKEKPIGRIIVLTDISDLKRAMLNMEYLSMHDSLTGLKNRAYFETRLPQMDKEDNYPLGIILGDVNGLKVVNDAFGHKSGDLLLQTAAATILGTCSEESMVARIGGDEFAIVLPRCNESEIKEIIEAIRNNCLKVDSLPVPLSISFGFAVKTQADLDINTIFRQADKHMYKSKLLESRSMRNSLIIALQKTLEERNIETAEHLDRTRQLAVNLGRKIGLPDHLLNDLNLLALLHDIGKLGIPDDILLKPCSLTANEWEIMKTHSEKGYHIASSIPEIVPIAEAILHHHEHWNGKGYPYGLQGENIPLLSRLISIVDAFDVMTHDRPYHKAISEAQALAEIESCAGSQFDPGLTKPFIELITEDLSRKNHGPDYKEQVGLLA